MIRGGKAQLRNSTRWQHRSARGSRVALILLLLLLGHQRSTFAAGDEYTLQGDDLKVTVSTKWAGCSSGGYYPIRLLVQNRGVDCTLSFTFTSDQEGIAAVRRTIPMAQNATIKFTLPIPCVGLGTYGNLRVYRNGRLVKGMERSLTIPDAHVGGTARPSLLVISPTDVDFDAFESAVTSKLPGVAGGSSGHGYGRHGYFSVAAENHERIEPTILPEEWIAYFGVDFVAVPLATLQKFTTSERSALIKWVEAGGALIVYNVGDETARDQTLSDLLGLHQHADVSPEWQPANPERRQRITIIDADDYGSYGVPQPETNAAEVVEKPADFVWPGDAQTFASRNLMLGHIYAFRENPFPGSPHDWDWFLKSVPTDDKTWAMRQGINARVGTDEFLQFLIPSVRGVPVMAFLLLITLFTVIIGPLNYIFLWRRRRLYLLVVTIPLIALGTSLALFGYSAIAHGFATKSRSRSVTYVDQQAKTAVTIARTALYAGLAPSNGLTFSADTAVMPVWPEDHQFDSATTDWTDQQNLRKGWINSRTRTQFLTLAHRDERGRLDVTPTSDGLTVTNGFEWDLAALIVSDQAGGEHYGNNIPAGATAELVPITTDQRREFSELLRRYPLRPPDLSGDSGSWFNWNIGRMFGYDPSSGAHFSSSLLERQLTRAQNQQFSDGASSTQGYTAVLDGNPGIQMGMDNTRPQASLHVLRGRY